MPPMFYSMLLTWFRSLRIASWVRRVLGGMAVAVLLVACLPYFLHAGPAPAWLGDFAGQLAANQGMQMHVKAIRMEGWGRATLEDVVLQPRAQIPELEEVSAERVVVIFDWLPLIQGQIPQVREVRVEHPNVMVALPDPARESSQPSGGSKTPALPAPSIPTEGSPMIDWSHPVRFDVREGHLRVQDQAFEDVIARFDLQGTLRTDELEVDRWALDVQGDVLAGTLQGDGRATWDDGALQLVASARGKRIHVATAADVYRVAEVNMEARYDGASWVIDALGSGHDGSAISLVGAFHSQEGMAFAVHAAGVDLAREIPFLERYGFAGEGTFDGTLTGPPGSFVLEGDATIGPGRVWGRPHSRAQGHLAVTSKGLAFSEVRVHQEVGRYDLTGTFEFARPEDDFPGHLEISLDAHAGRLQDLLAILEAEDLPLVGRIYGSLAFGGLLGEIGASGDVKVLDARVWDQPLDQVDGMFTWEAGRLNLGGVQARLGAGRLEADGSLDVDRDAGIVDMHFAALAWPLGDTQVFQENWGHVAGGRIDIVNGRLTGPMEDPLLTAQVVSDGLRLGPAAFHGVQGGVRLSTEGLAIEELIGMRSGGGTYRLAGGFRPDVSGGITTDTVVTVSDEQLRDLLRLAGQDLPAALINGPVVGEIAVRGDLTQPDARLDLLWGSVVEGTGSGVELALELVDQKLRVERFGFTGSERQS